MTLKTKYGLASKFSIAMLIVMLWDTLAPTVSWALTSGPAQPEFSSFEPVATTNMVNEFSGDLTYNLPIIEIPGANGGGYAMSLSYHSGTTPEEESSWVGYGWTLNPGSISRGKRGFPDDDKNVNVKYWNQVPDNKTASVGIGANGEALSLDLPINLNYSLRYNNYKGFGYTAGAGIQFAKGIVSLGYSVSDGDGSFSARVNPMSVLSSSLKGQAKDENQQSKLASDPAKKKKHSAANNATKGIGAVSLIGSNYGIFSHGEEIRNINVTKYTAQSTNYTVSLLGTPTFIQAGANIDLSGNFNYQRNTTQTNMPVYGYLYSNAAVQAGSGNMMDYYMEKLNPYDKQDRYMGMPFSNADNFSLSGEGLGGNFRAYHKEAGHFRPNSVTSNTQIINAGGEIEIGLNIGGGLDLGVGFQRLTTANWTSSSVNSADFSSASNDEQFFFRFANDQGGYVDYGSDAAQQAKVKYVSGVPGNKRFEPNISSMTTLMNNDARSGRSSYVAYHTNDEMIKTQNSKQYKSYSLSGDVNGFVNRTSTGGLSDAIGEFAIFNEDGTRYVYGLPVYSRKEINLQYDLQGVPAADIENNYIAYRNINSIHPVYGSKVGEERDKPYATSHLLTEITSADYVDRKFDGPTDDDFGGYTRFSYARKYGSYTKDSTGGSFSWYKWRMPYRGLLYNRGELSTSMDDMGSVSYGEKEIYYMDSVITKTHFAVFHTSVRQDGYGDTTNSIAAQYKNQKGAFKLFKLDSIKVYSKNPGGNPKLLKRVRFEYDYALAKGVPNVDVVNTTGKMTLKKVWFEYEGIYNAKISPYVFEYNYSTKAYPEKYPLLDSLGIRPSPDLGENPNYSAFSIDAWGNYQKNGSTRFNNMQSWVDQTPDGDFDPAAWQLKVIKLPTGGEIHIQYEQDDYKYVQDKWAHSMMSLDAATDATEGSSNNKYYLNVSSDFGSSTDTASLRKLINDLYVVPGNKMYFKFLYKLVKEPNSNDPTLTSCNSEYVKGYCSVKKVGRESSGPNQGKLYVILGSGSSGNYDLPKKVCRDYVKTQRAGNINVGGNCDPSATGIPINGSPDQVVESLVIFLKNGIIPGNSEFCVRINPTLSYLKVPVPFTKKHLPGKKGGGVRVKRLLMYDKGIESGDLSLFGSEYSYLLADSTSSGVATNEPSSIREENAVVEFDAKLKQTFFNKVVAGRDKEQAEKPLGESILPGASVGYSRVVIKNIHSGTTNTGFVVKEFFTAKDYPVKVDYTPIETERDFLPIPGGLINIFISNLWMSQGFVFTLNNMHGQPRSETTYRGDPGDMANASISSQQAFTYFEPGDQVPVMNSLNNITNTNPGKEEELVFESRAVEDIANDISMEIDLDVGLAFIPIPFFSIIPSYTYTESKMHSHATTKIINYPVIQKSVLSYADGIYHLTENLAFNPHSGKPIVTRTTDGFNKLNLQLSSNHKGSYTNYVFPASQQYQGTGQKAKNERLVVNSGTNQTITINGNNPYYLKFDGSNGCSAMGNFCPGDVGKVTSKNTPGNFEIFHFSDSMVANKLYIYRIKNFDDASYSLSTSSEEVNIEILRSGCTNQLNNNVGQFTTYGDTATTASSISASDRQWLKDTLNTLLAACALSCPNCSRTIPPNKIPSGLKVINKNNGQCIALNTYSVTVGCYGSSDVTITVNNGAEFICEEILGNSQGCFALDENFELIFKDPPCSTSCIKRNVTCLNFCPDIAPYKKVNVVSADAQTFSDFWAYDGNIFPKLNGSNNYENGTKGKWRVQSNYVYRDTIIGANASNQRIYKNAGVFELQTFNWKFPSAIDTNKWVKVSTVTQYSPDGNAMEEKDVLGIYSSAKFGYDRTQPYLVAKNAEYQAVQFDGFEKAYTANGDTLEDGWAPSGISTKRVNNVPAHSGLYSWKLASSDSIALKDLKLTQQIKNNGIVVKVWARDTAVANGTPVIASFVVNGTYKSATVTKIARTGEWALYEAKLSSSDLSGYSVGITITPRIRNNYSTKSIWIDDIRYQPADAQMIAYVYDINTLRLITTFDDQHFGLYYQYNAEGKLVRKQIETEKGLKTITETQYHTPTVSR